MLMMKRTLGKWLMLATVGSVTLFVLINIHLQQTDNIINVYKFNEQSDSEVSGERVRIQRDILDNNVPIQNEVDASKFHYYNAMETCSQIKEVHHNNADIQVSSLVEDLDFHLEHGGHVNSSFPELEALPFSEPLRVFLIPHSHCDPGWIHTYTHYYDNKVRYILTWLYIFAIEHEDFKYIYAEVSFFKLWWEEQDEDIKEDMRMLAREGRFEFVQGGWVMTDEANSHYFAMFNEMLDGHDWLKQNLPEAIPKSGWAIDPFGLSPTMAHVNKLFGLTGMHIQRVHYSLKNHLARTRNLDFRWRQSWDTEGVTDIHTHLGPFVSYGQQHSCGPDPDVCCSFNFMSLRTGAYSCHSNETVIYETTEENVMIRSLQILDQWRLKAALHSANTVFIELGNDFTYALKEEVHAMYDNYKGIIDYINNQPGLNTKVSWGTLSEYFAEVSKKKLTLPSLSGDFFTYADREADYWSGYYTSRPFYKSLDRVLESALRRTEIVFSFYRTSRLVRELVAARQTLSLFQHHDGITGTATSHVVDDYGARLFNAYKTCNRLTLSAIRFLLKADSSFKTTTSRLAFNTVEKQEVLVGANEVVVLNTLARDTQTVEILAINATTPKIYKVGGGKVEQQIEPNIEYGVIHYDSTLLVFLAETPPVAAEMYTLVGLKGVQVTRTTVDTYNYPVPPSFHELYYSREHHRAKCDNIVIGSQKLKLALNCKSGRVLWIMKDGVKITAEQEIVLYTGKSGIYLFLPDGPGIDQVSDEERPRIVVVRGPVRHKAIVQFHKPRITISYIINLVDGMLGEYLELEILTDLKQLGDLAMRFKTDIKSEGSLFTDLNGHTIQHHKYKEKLQMQGNFFPMPTTAFIQDTETRLTVLGAEPHGAASLESGWLEVVLDRRSVLDDQRGVGQGHNDNVPTPARLRILVERATFLKPSSKGYMVEYPSLLSYWTQQTLLYPTFLAYKPLLLQNRKQTHKSSVQLMTSLACDEELVNLRNIDSDRSLMIIRKLGFSCQMDNAQYCTHKPKGLKEAFTQPVEVEEHPMSPFHEKQTTENHVHRAMEFASYYVTFLKGELN